MKHVLFQFQRLNRLLYLGTNLCCTPHIKDLMTHKISADLDLEEKALNHVVVFPINMWIPVQDRKAPTLKQLSAGVNFLESMVALGEKTYIHCKNGHGRGPTFAIAYFMKAQSLTFEEARSFVQSKRGEMHLETSQMRMLKKYERTLKNHAYRGIV